MKIAVLSDSHGRNATVIRALDLVRGHGLDTVLHCGDIEDPETIALFHGLTAHFVLGNCDGDGSAIRNAVAAAGATLHEPFGNLKLAGKAIGFLHSHDRTLFRELESSDAFDFLFYGHSHQREQHRTGRTLVLNPGALHRARPKTFAVVDLTAGEVEWVEVPESDFV